MQQAEPRKITAFSFTAKLFHWGFILIFAYGVIKQIENIEQLEDLQLLKFEIIFALIFIMLLATRFFYMKRTQKSSLPPETTKLQRAVASLVHYGMYIVMISIALSGLFIGILYWLGFSSGILIDSFIFWHETSVLLVYWLIGFHLLGALYHRFKNDGVWESMVPIFQNKK